jgi:hypothetical protein
MARKPDYDVFVSEKNGDKTFYTKIGAAWKVGSDGVSIKLKPNLAVSGECVLFPVTEGEQ